MGESLEDLYFNWLRAKALLSEPPQLSYEHLIRKLYDTEFVWLVTGDDNRVSDSLLLRQEFIDETQLDIDEDRFTFGCTVLELFIHVSRIAEFQTDISCGAWFWEFVLNLGLSEHHDDCYNDQEVSDILYNFVWRTYEANGQGGMFPIAFPEEDQTNVEVFYQLCAYINERQLV